MTTTRQDWAELECDGALIDVWTQYSFESDLFTPADSASLSVGIGTSSPRDLMAGIARARSLLAPGKEVKLWIYSSGKRALQGAYVIDRNEVGNDADGGTQLSIKLRDRAQHLISSAADPKLYEANDTLVSVARRAVAPWSIEVTADHVGSRDLRQARVTKDKLARLKAKARAWGLPPSTMSEKIAASIDKGTISFADFAAAQVGATVNVRQFAGQGALSDYAKPDSVSVSRIPPIASTVPYRNTYIGVPYSGAAGLSSLAIYQLKVKDIRPQSGETVWEFLDRSAKRNGLLMSVTPDGKLLFCGLHYEQEPSYQITRRVQGDRTKNNVVSGGMSLDISDVYSEVLVYGRVKGKDVARSPFKGRAVSSVTDVSAVPFVKTLVIHDNSIKSAADAQNRAEYELGKSKQGSLVLEYTMQGHSSSGLMYTPDTIAHVVDEVAGINGPYYMTARTFTRSNRQGPMTSVKLIPKGAIVLSSAGDLSE